MKAWRTTIGLGIVAVLSLALAPLTQAAPAGDEYLPKVPQAIAGGSDGSGGSGGSGGSRDFSGSRGASSSPTPTTALPSGESAEPQGKKAGKKASKRSKKQEVPVPVSGSGGSGGDSSDSILLNPIVLLMIAAVIAAAVGMTLWRRHAEEGNDGDAPEEVSRGAEAGSPRTPDGEIVAGPDQAS